MIKAIEIEIINGIITSDTGSSWALNDNKNIIGRHENKNGLINVDFEVWERLNLILNHSSNLVLSSSSVFTGSAFPFVFCITLPTRKFTVSGLSLASITA